MSENLKNIIRDDSIIWEIIKTLSTEQIFETNKYFNIISTRLLKIFGYNNKSITEKDLLNEIKKSLEVTNTDPEKIYELDYEDIPGVISWSPTIDGIFEYEKIVDLSGNSSLYIYNTNTGKHYYIKIGNKDKAKIIFISDSNDQGSFKICLFHIQN